VTRGQQFSLQLVHLMMASWAETCSVRIREVTNASELRILTDRRICTGILKRVSANLAGNCCISVPYTTLSLREEVVALLKNKDLETQMRSEVLQCSHTSLFNFLPSFRKYLSDNGN
jgi:hypothetical protein